MSKASRPPTAAGSAEVADRLSGFPKARLLAALGLFALTLWTFFPAIENGFVGYDDPELVTENRHVLSGINWENVKWAFGAPAAANWHPLTLLSHMLDCHWFGLAPWGHHLMNVVGHALSAVLLFLALQRMTRATGRSLAVALLFALHPLRVESVAWVAERKDILSTFFGMLALYAYAGYAAHAAPKDPRAKWYYGLTLAAFVAALLSKPMLVTLPFVLLLLDYWPLGRMQRAEYRAKSAESGNAPRASSIIHHWSFILLEKLPFLVITLVLGVITYVVHHRAGDILTGLTLASRIANATVSYARYLGKLAWPAGLSPFYPLAPSLPPGVVWGAGVLLVVVTLMALVLWRTRPFFVVGWLWYLGTLVPVIGLVQIGGESMADRYTYIPCIGLLMVLIWGLHSVLRPLSRRLVIDVALVTLASLACIALTRQQIARWRDTETLFRHALAVTQGNYIAHNNLGTALDRQGRLAEAAAEFRNAIQDKPDYAEAYNNLGIVLSEQDQPDQAVTQYL
jgi:protein O-mannosyl-transferase